MRRLIERCAGLDVHRDTVAACVRVPGEGGERRQEVRTFGTTTAQLALLREWLVGLEITLVGMESTGIYWRPVFAQIYMVTSYIVSSLRLDDLRTQGAMLAIARGAR
jgi:hypothetical protein